MPRGNRIPTVIGLCAALAAACGPGKEQIEARARPEEWAAIQADRAALEGLRGELAAAAQSSQGNQPSQPTTGEGLEAEVAAAADRFLERVVAFLNQHSGKEGDRPPPEVEAAIRLKSSEELILAREYIDRGGDYARAIDILARALPVDPGNRELEAALAEAERLRYMDQERFARVEVGMTEADVRRELGQVQRQNVRPYEGGRVVAWFYPREAGAAAAVFFGERAGRLEVVDADFEALKSAAQRAAEDDPREDAAAN